MHRDDLVVAIPGLADGANVWCKLAMDAALRERLLSALVGRQLVSNAFRGTLVEAILSKALEPEWRWMADGWGSYDFENADGIGLEVKQSAALQDWHGQDAKPHPGRFDIAARQGRWEGPRWIEAPGRAAEIYVFAWHPVCQFEAADHRVAQQWEFYVVLARNLPEQKTIGLGPLKQLAQPVGIDAVAKRVRLELAARLYPGLSPG